MNMRRWSYGLAAAFLAFACSPGADAPEEMPPDEVEPTTTSQELEEFRGEVAESFDEIRAELAEMREAVQAESAETWEDLSGSAERASDEVMADIERLRTATAEEAEQIQTAAGDRLAELEAEVARRDVENSPDSGSLIEAMNERLTELEADLDAIGAHTGMGATPPPPGTPTDQSMVTEQEIMDLRTRISDARAELEQAAMATGAEFEAAREELGEELAELTRDVRREFYEVRWGLDEAA
jgi:hypothetical protein